NNVSSYGVVNGTFISAYSGTASWQAAGYDTHGSNAASSLSGTYSLNSGSAAIGLGTNLSSMCNGQPNPGIGALCFDKNGVARPGVGLGAWDAGAFQFIAAGSSPTTTIVTPLPVSAVTFGTAQTFTATVTYSGGPVTTGTVTITDTTTSVVLATG